MITYLNKKILIYIYHTIYNALKSYYSNIKKVNPEYYILSNNYFIHIAI